MVRLHALFDDGDHLPRRALTDNDACLRQTFAVSGVIQLSGRLFGRCSKKSAGETTTFGMPELWDEGGRRFCGLSLGGSVVAAVA